MFINHFQTSLQILKVSLTFSSLFDMKMYSFTEKSNKIKKFAAEKIK